MSRLACLSTSYLSSYGFSIGLGDVTPSDELVSQKEELVKKGYVHRCYVTIFIQIEARVFILKIW